MLTKTRQEDPQLPDWKFEQRLGAVTRTDRFEFLMSRARNKKVLHIGCADGHLHRFLGSVASELWGVDLSEERIADMRRVGYRNIYQGDAEQLQRIPELRGQHFDAIIAGEMIEHLNNPGLFLDGCRFLSSANTEVIITTPNALMYSLPIFRAA
jgi:2-polyprenyl-3-methyl-5-hydroxy-6-metoxy-1,4-benzoquinol methylase